jgi:hypothetical protein
MGDKMHVGGMTDAFSSVFCFINFKQSTYQIYIYII